MLALAAVAAVAVFSSCSERLGWGVLLWTTDDPFIPSGTVLPVYTQPASADRVWVVGLPEGILTNYGLDKMEVPFTHFEMIGSKARAEARAAEFAPYALVYAETLQFGLPIRVNPNNNARSIYRLRTGQILKIVGVPENSVAPIGVTGEPLPGSWYRVLTEDGVVGYTFSYRLRLFEHAGGSPGGSGTDVAQEGAMVQVNLGAPELEILLTRTWVPESFAEMINARRINLEDLSRRWHFNPGRENNVARVYMPGVNQFFPYSAIVSGGWGIWRFEGTSLTAQLRGDALTVQFNEGANVRTFNFVSLSANLDDVIAGEQTRRSRLYSAILSHGPTFTSGNFGTISFNANGTFNWDGFDLLVPAHIPHGVLGRGRVSMDLFLAPALMGNNTGAFTMRFTGGDGRTTLRAMYSVDAQGFRLEIVPEANIDGVTVQRRAASPMVLFFFADNEIAAAESASGFAEAAPL